MQDAITIENNWRSRGFSFELWEDPPGQIWKDFKHETDELFMLLEGEVISTVGNKTLKPAIGGIDFRRSRSYGSNQFHHRKSLVLWLQNKKVRE